VLLLASMLAVSCGPRIKGKTPDERELSASELGVNYANENIPVLVKAVETEPENVQVAAIVALGTIGTPEAVAGLAKFSRHESRMIRLTVAQALASVLPESYPAAAEILVQMGKEHMPVGPGDDPGRNIRRAVTTSLAVVKQKVGLEFLVDRVVRDTDDNIRNAATMTLGRLKDPLAVDALIHVYENDDNKNRAWAIEALGTIGDPRALPTVVAGLEDYDAITRGKAAWAVMQLQREAAIPALRGMLSREAQDMPAVVAAHALALLGDPEGVALLEDRVQNASSMFARAEAARSLGDVGRRETIPLLVRVYKNDREGLVKHEAGEAVTKLQERFPSKGNPADAG